MSVISGDDYLAIANAYADAYNRMISCIAYFYEPVTSVVILDDVQPTLDLLQTVYTSYQVNEARIRSRSFYEATVRALNNHVILQSTEKDLNDYLAANVPTGVPASWKTMSDSIGFTIDAGNVA